MKRLTKYINEILNESIFDKNLAKDPLFKYHPKNRKELQEYILDEIKLQGPNANLNCIDVRKVTSMVGLFSDLNKKIKIGNINISLWNVSKVKNMNLMFSGCREFNSDLSQWDVRNVTDAYGMFDDCWSFDCDLSGWDVKNLKDKRNMFADCKSLSKIPDWWFK